MASGGESARIMLALKAAPAAAVADSEAAAASAAAQGAEAGAPLRVVWERPWGVLWYVVAAPVLMSHQLRGS